ncbi:ornithine cyclodeaminase family protein [Ktedonobacter robiniae]|nr:ornithine cyclodeaminase family protein [Ktedonobacter robiniae]
MTLSHDDAGILYLCEDEVKLACQHLDSIAVMHELFRLYASGETILPDEAYLAWANPLGESVRSLNMPGYVGGSINQAGTKIINGNIANPRRGLPRASGLTLLYDPTTVRIACIMEGAYISSLRTASVSLLATRLCAGRPIECAAIIGAGVLAQRHIELLVQQIPSLVKISLFDLDKQRVANMRTLLTPLLEDSHVVLIEETSAQRAVEGAQLIIPVTTTTTGYIPYAWLQPGAILVNVSLDDPLPDVVLQADKIIVDDWDLIKNDTRRLLGRMYRSGEIIGPDDPHPQGSRARRIDAHLGDVVMRERVGRESDNDIILVNPFGLSIEDIALATYVYQEALRLHLGTPLKR